MKKVININFQGRVVPIEENAYDILKQYVDSLRCYFANEEGKDEIINDIESRIAELFAEILKKGSTCITDEDVNNIIKSMGRPEDFDDEEAKVHSQLGGNTTEKTQNTKETFTSGNRRLYRDENNKILGGVCSGIANYFGIDPLIIRVLAVVGNVFSFWTYLILWIAIPSTAIKVIGSYRKRLLRDMDDKIIGGVCSGLGHYFGIKVWIPRVLFLVPFLSFVTQWHNWGLFGFPHFISLSFSPGASVLYIILWMVLPEAVTSADKLEMKGERVDLNSIKHIIQTDMEGFKGRAEKFGADLKNRAEGLGKDFGPRAQTFGNEVTDAARRTSLGLGGVIILFVKIFAYFIIGVLLFGLIVGLFAAGVAFIGISPVFNYIFTDGRETALAWVGIVLFVWSPIIGIIIFVARRITKTTRNSGLVRYTFLSLWIAGIICLISLFVSIRNDFRYKSTGTDEKVSLTNPKIDKLEVQLSGYGNSLHGKHWLKIEPFEGIDTDTVFVPNTDIRIIKSLSDSFEVTVLRVSNGITRNVANDLADKIKYSITQKDSILSLYKGIQINSTDKFRNQRMIITIAVPLGKKIKIDDKIGWRTHLNFGMNSNDWNWRDDYGNEDEMNWETNKEYIMTAKGLKQLDRMESQIDDNSNDNNNSDDIKQKRDELKQEIDDKKRERDDKQREMDDKKRELKELDEQQREHKLNADSAAEKGKYQKTVTVPNNEKIKPAEGELDQLPSLINVI